MPMSLHSAARHTRLSVASNRQASGSLNSPEQNLASEIWALGGHTPYKARGPQACLDLKSRSNSNGERLGCTESTPEDTMGPASAVTGAVLH